jgi:hypothetical protein
MAHSIYKETEADNAVKARLWASTESELRRFAARYAEEHIVGSRVSEGQEDVACAAKGKGYPKTVVRALGSLYRRDMSDADVAAEVVSDYRHSLGLSEGRV